ncbi:MAG TPA: type II toxin-antitoxin system antitoxin SocA domain-containing protein [Puia sp.]|nr:type II toxin-antitoxin system antitoxin SocA domain-containing protein [Puia sp.]
MLSGKVGYTKEQIDKIGNTIIYLSQHIRDLTKTKILKILFLLEEASIKRSGQPFIGIDFQLWKLGPVAKDIFIDSSSVKFKIKKRLQ